MLYFSKNLFSALNYIHIQNISFDGNFQRNDIFYDVSFFFLLKINLKNYFHNEFLNLVKEKTFRF